MATVLGSLRTTEFATRVAARLIDGWVVFAATAALAGLGSLLLPDDGWLRWPWEHSAVSRSLLAGVYEVGFLIAAAATPGKRAMKIEVVDVNSGRPVGPVAAVVRTGLWMGAAWVPDVGFIVALLFALPILWTGFGVHDWLARTWVVARVSPPEPA